VKFAVGKIVKKMWQHPLVCQLDVDAAHAIEAHRRMIEAKPLLRRHYVRWYRECLPAYEATKNMPGLVVEIGSGGGFLDQFIPELVKTDVVPTANCERVLDAMHMDFEDGEVKNLFLIGAFHHIPVPTKFLQEAQRCLRVGGRLVMIEPTNNPFQRFLAKHLDHYEHYDDKIPEWIDTTWTRMSGANLSLAWVIFFRDRDRFAREFPTLRLKRVRYHTFLSYILSGGMSYRSFLPGFAGPVVDLVEALSAPFMKHLATAMTLDLVKTEG